MKWEADFSKLANKSKKVIHLEKPGNAIVWGENKGGAKIACKIQSQKLTCKFTLESHASQFKTS